MNLQYFFSPNFIGVLLIRISVHKPAALAISKTGIGIFPGNQSSRDSMFMLHQARQDTEDVLSGKHVSSACALQKDLK